MLSLKAGYYAWESQMKIVGNQKEKYKPKDAVVIKKYVEMTHRSCSESLKITKIESENLEIIESSEWVNDDAGIWEKTIKVKVLKNNDGKASVITERGCNREGGFGDLTLITSKS
jgi:hypothetical protein